MYSYHDRIRAVELHVRHGKRARAAIRQLGYPTHRVRFDAADRYVDVRRTLNEIFENNHRCYGYRRMRGSLNKQCVGISEKVAQRLIKQECLVVATPKRR